MGVKGIAVMAIAEIAGIWIFPSPGFIVFSE
jgi:hypothetical protein